MLKDVATNKDVKELPGILNTYSINGRTGRVYDMLSGSILKPIEFDGCKYVELTRCSDKKMWKVAVLQIIAYKGLSLHMTLWNLLDAMHVDDNLNNLDAENIVVKFPKAGIQHWYFKDWYYVPHHTRYAINKVTMELMDTFTLKSISISIPVDDLHYPTVFVAEDTGGVKTGKGYHRLVALTFHTDYPSNVDELHVNHKNGNKRDYSVDNVEWTTVKENVQHAFKTGLISFQLPILRKDVILNVVDRFSCMAEAAREENIHTSVMQVRVREGNQRLHDGRYIYKLESDDTPWRTDIDIKAEMRRTGIKRPLKMRNVFTGEISEVASISEAAKVVGVTSAVVDIYLKPTSGRERIYPCGHYDIKDIDDNTPWKEHSEYKLEIIRRKISLSTTVFKSINLRTAEVIIWYGTKELAEMLGVIRTHVNDVGARGGVCKGYKLEKCVI